MKLTVEFFGIPRLRAGRAIYELSLTESCESATLAEILAALAQELPAFARDCVAENRLRSGYIANASGQRFLSDPNAIIHNGESLLILSADAGG